MYEIPKTPLLIYVPYEFWSVPEREGWEEKKGVYDNPLPNPHIVIYRSIREIICVTPMMLMSK